MCGEDRGVFWYWALVFEEQFCLSRKASNTTSKSASQAWPGNKYPPACLQPQGYTRYLCSLNPGFGTGGESQLLCRGGWLLDLRLLVSLKYHCRVSNTQGVAPPISGAQN
jgi:hypothetical protein